MTDADTDVARDLSLLYNRSRRLREYYLSLRENSPHCLCLRLRENRGLDMSAAQRFVYTLRVIGLISRDESTRRYRLTSKLLHFGYSSLRSSDLVNRCSSHLLELNDRIF